jgi:hypothetical protein
MKYLCLAYGDEKDWKQLSKAEQDALLAQDDVLRQRGDLVAAVEPSATTVRAWDGVPKATKGGFAESQVPLAGFSIIDAPDLERAIELVADTPCARAGGAVELHPIDRINDHGARSADILGQEARATIEPIPTPTPTLGDEHRRLEVFLGQWTVTGESVDVATGALGVPVTGEESYVFLPGRFFLLGHWDRRFASGTRHIGMTTIRYDAAARVYMASNVDNLGFARTYLVTPDDDVWYFTGDWERATMRFGDDSRTMTIDWEVTKDGSTWLPLCHLEATKAA